SAGSRLACFLFLLNHLNLLRLLHDNLRLFPIEFYHARDSDGLVLEEGGGVVDLRLLELFGPLLVDENGEVVGVLEVFLGIQENHAIALAGGFHRHLHRTLFVALLRRRFGGQRLRVLLIRRHPRWQARQREYDSASTHLSSSTVQNQRYLPGCRTR